MNRLWSVLASALLLALISASLAGAQSKPPSTASVDPARVRAIAAQLKEAPSAPGHPISDRAFWDGWAAEPAYREVVTRAEGLLKQPLPEQPDDLYLEFSRNGNRTHWQSVSSARRGRLTALVLAECLENKGRFIPAIEQLVTALCAERTWVLPAHDAKLENFNGKTIDIELGSSALGWNLAMADYLLGDRLGAASKQQIRENIRRRILTPFEDMISGKRPPNWWLTTTNNWNAVCLAGVIGAALEQIPSREERARFAAAAEKYSRYFLSGFTPDGYCSEGLGYWNYGFGHFVLLSETIRQATDGKLDLLARPEAAKPATFGTRIQIMNGLSPAFADCPVFARASAPLLVLVSRRLHMTLPGYTTANPRETMGSLFEAMIYGIGATGSASAEANSSAKGPALQDWFDSAGILIARPAPGSKTQMGVALKGGNNDEHHNHNDIGSYVVALGERPVLLDPGSETYAARTFSSKRYESKLLSSFGHSVPVVAGTLQRPGAEAQAKILATKFSDTTDTLSMDITSAYPVKDLKRLERTFVYSREGTGSLTVSDKVELGAPETFETAILTLGSWQKQPDGSLLVFDVDQALKVEVDTGGKEFTVEATEIHEDAPVVPTRLGIRLKDPVAAATITLKITPWTESGTTGNSLLRNGGFEAAAFGWELPRNGFGSISTEQAATGKASLKISDHDPKAGSNVTSALIPLPTTKGGAYIVRGKVYYASGSKGIGLYVRYLDKARQPLNPKNANGDIAPAGTLSGAEGKWEPFSFRFEAPPDATSLQIWIHSFNGAELDAYIDDLEIVPAP